VGSVHVLVANAEGGRGRHHPRLPDR
jgi:hypothetical protein